MTKFTKEVELALSKLPQRKSKHHPESYIGGGQSKLRYIGLRMPDLHQALKVGFSFSASHSSETAKTWDHIWHSSDCFEVMQVALLWFNHSKQRQDLRQYWSLLKKWAVRVDNWAHADSLSCLYARILEEDPKVVLPQLKKWNVSKNPWLRRLSIVSLIYYSSQRQQYLPFEEIISLLRPQIEFDHYYVQKGVGWTLRECHRVYPEETYAFVLEHIHVLSSYAFSTAREKMSPKKRDHLKKVRLQRRLV